MNGLGAVFGLLTRDERRSGLVLFGLMFLGMLLETLGIGMVVPTIALLLQGDALTQLPALAPLLARFRGASPLTLPVVGLVTLVAVYAVKTAYLVYLTWRQNKFGYDIQANLSLRLFATYLDQPYVFHLRRNSAQLIRNAITEVNQFTFNVFLPLLQLLSEGMVLAGIGMLLLFLEPLGTVLVAFGLGGVSWVFARMTQDQVRRWGASRQWHEGLRLQHLQQGLAGAKDVKVLGREAMFVEQYRVHNAASARMTELQVTLQAFPRLWLEFLGVLAIAVLVLVMLASGRTVVGIMPTLAVFAAAAFRMMPSVNRVLTSVQALRYGHSVITVLAAELALPATSPVPEGGAPALLFRQAIAIDAVDYMYDGAAEPALAGLSLVVNRGESIGIIGPSGSGKSTLVDVLLGLLTPKRGRVLVDGSDVHFSVRSWQDQIGYVPQTVYLTDDSLRRNVAFGLPDDGIDEAAVMRALRAAQLEEFVAALPEGLDALVGERGVRLSGGQRQRIGIARALYRDPPILVLDEATSALDTVTEQGVMAAVNALHGEKTVVIVAHRLSTVANCDRLYRLEQGCVVAEGPPSALLRLSQAV